MTIEAGASSEPSVGLAASFDSLLEGTRTFVEAALAIVEGSLRAGPGSDAAGVAGGEGRQALAAAILASPEHRDLRPLVRAAAESASYLERFGQVSRHKSYGRALQEGWLVEVGFIEWLSSAPTDIGPVVQQLSSYLAGPPVGILHLIGLDAVIELRGGPVSLGDWELVVHGEEALAAMLPMPAITEYRERPEWDSALWAGSAFLQRVDPDARAMAGMSIPFRRPLPEGIAWPAVIVLACWDTRTVASAWSEHLVEPGRRVDTGFDDVWYDLLAGEDYEYERPARGSVWVSPGKEQDFRRFCEAVSAVLPSDSESDKRTKLLRRSATRFIAAGEHSVGRPEPFNAERLGGAILNYVAALEGLLGGAPGTEIGRRVSQRAAVLAGATGARRIDIQELVKRSYDARSVHAHGGELRDKHKVDVEALRALTSEVIVCWAAASRAFSTPDGLLASCDRALLSVTDLDALRAPIEAMLDARGAGRRG
ncbi:hypothetical protein ACE2AJ_18750 [Aquihabitans daechungensis]|uniref:hypothetical protein n=1 Tax=Aquihabitans daechungensis TaxID=1052257 RepID=UPI003BA252BB